MERVLPKTIDYGDVLPLAVESRSRRRTFFPVNGQEFSSAGANIIRIDLSADALLDTQHSYLRFNVKTTGAITAGMDYSGGHGFIRRLRIQQSGTTLEDINNYNRLMGAVVLPCQSGSEHTLERSASEFVRMPGGSGLTADGQSQDDTYGGITLPDITATPLGAITPMTSLTNAEIGAAGSDGTGALKTDIDASLTSVSTEVGNAFTSITNKINGLVASVSETGGLVGALHNPNTQLQAQRDYAITIPLNSGLLNCDKLLPLMLMSAPLTIEMELAQTNVPMCLSGAMADGYTISNVRYIANLIEVGGDVAQQLRMVQEASGGVLTLAGQTYSHFAGNLVAGNEGDQVINVPARVKSMKSLFFVSQGEGGIEQSNRYGCSFGGNCLMNSYQLKIGSVVYPPTPVRCGFTTAAGLNGQNGAGATKSEPLFELAKAWGNVGSNKGMGQLSVGTLYATERTQPLTQGFYSFSPFGLDLEAFQRVAIESGVNTADRSLPMSLVLNTGAMGSAQGIDAFVLADALFYINSDGSMSVSV